MADQTLIPATPTVDPTVAPVASVPAISNTPYAAPAAMTPSAATSLVNQYGIDPTQVLSSANVAQTLNAPTPKPDDLLGIRAALSNTLGVNQAQTDYQASVKAYQDAQNLLNSQNLQLGNRAVSMSKITGEQGQNTRVNEQNINNLLDASNLSLQTLNAKKQELDTQFAIKQGEVQGKQALQAQYAGAGIKLTDSYDEAIKKISKYQEQQVSDAYKQTLKTKAMELGIKTSGSTKDLEKRIGSASKSALAQAQVDRNLKNQETQASIDNIRSTIADRNKPKETSSTQSLSNDIASMSSQLSGQRGPDGRISNQDYNFAKQAWVNAGNSAVSFDQNFSYLVDTTHASDYNLNFNTANQANQ